MKRIGTLNGKTIVETSDLNTLKDNEVAIRYDGDKLTLLERKDNGEIIEISGDYYSTILISYNRNNTFYEYNNMDEGEKALCDSLIKFNNFKDKDYIGINVLYKVLPKIEYGNGIYMPTCLWCSNNQIYCTYTNYIGTDNDANIDGMKTLFITLIKSSEGTISIRHTEYLQ